MPGQYPYTWTEALGILRDNVRDFKDSELETLWEEDAADWIYVDGEVRFRSSFLKNVLKTRKEYENRAMDPELVRSKAENFALLNRTIASMKERGGAGMQVLYPAAHLGFWRKRSGTAKISRSIFLCRLNTPR